MDFWSHIESKSSGVKAQYSFLIAGLVTGIIGMVWVSTLPARFSKLGEQEESLVEDSPGFGEMLTDTKAQLGNIIETTKETVAEESFNTDSLDSLGESSFREDSTEVNTTQVPTEEVPVVISPSVATTTPEATPETKSPKMILIGTTTSQKGE